MARRKLTNKLVLKTSIKEQLVKIEESDVDYITPSGKVYSDYGNNMFYPKTNFVNKHNGYLYVSINTSGGQVQRRVHVLVAKAFVPNPNNNSVVMHIDNNKQNPSADNLKWGTTSENIKAAFDDNLCKNDKGFDDSQSIAVCKFDLNGNYICSYGSISEAAREINVQKSTIINQCKNKPKRSKMGYKFRYLKEYEENGFVL